MNELPNDPQAAAAKLLQRAYSLKDDFEARELYAAWARTYDETMLQRLGYLTPTKTAQLLAEYLPGKSAGILDIGAGTGLAGSQLALLGYRNLDALDYSPEMLAVAAHRQVYSNLFEADLNKPLDIAGNTYDGLICTGTFTHAHVGANCLGELFRVLKPGGVFACTVHKDIWASEGFDEISGRLVEEGTISVAFQEMGKYYSQSKEPDGWYIVWKKQD